MMKTTLLAAVAALTLAPGAWAQISYPDGGPARHELSPDDHPGDTGWFRDMWEGDGTGQNYVPYSGTLYTFVDPLTKQKRAFMTRDSAEDALRDAVRDARQEKREANRRYLTNMTKLNRKRKIEARERLEDLKDQSARRETTGDKTSAGNSRSGSGNGNGQGNSH